MDSLTLLRALASLSATLGLIVLLGWAWRRYGQPLGHRFGLAQTPGHPTARLHILESRRLNAQTTLHLVQLDATEHLLATTAAQTTLIHTRTALKPASKIPPKSAKLPS